MPRPQVAEHANRGLGPRHTLELDEDSHEVGSTMTPTQRLVAILAVLRRARRVLPASEVQDRVGDYGGDPSAAERKWRRDIRILRERGLLATDLTTRTTPNRDGLALVRHVKPQLYELTEDEHATLRRARREVGTTRSAPSPVPVSGDLAESAGTAGGDLERAAQLVRYLEDVGLFPGLVLHYPSSLGVGETDDAGAERLAAEAGAITLVSLLRLARYDGTGSPTRGRGLDEIGRFAYSLPEVEDRLRLIETITQAWAGRPERRADVDRLDSVRWKLESWRSELQRQSVEMGAPY